VDPHVVRGRESQHRRDVVAALDEPVGGSMNGAASSRWTAQTKTTDLRPPTDADKE
jgi:hypothetical protein